MDNPRILSLEEFCIEKAESENFHTLSNFVLVCKQKIHIDVPQEYDILYELYKEHGEEHFLKEYAKLW